MFHMKFALDVILFTSDFVVTDLVEAIAGKTYVAKAHHGKVRAALEGACPESSRKRNSAHGDVLQSEDLAERLKLRSRLCQILMQDVYAALMRYQWKVRCSHRRVLLAGRALRFALRLLPSVWQLELSLYIFASTAFCPYPNFERCAGSKLNIAFFATHINPPAAVSQSVLKPQPKNCARAATR